MKSIKDLTINNFTILQTIMGAITLILAASVTVSILLIYSISTRTSKELVYDQASEINKQIVFNYENYTNRVVSIANLLQEKSLAYDMRVDSKEIIDLFATFEEIEDSIESVVLFNEQGEVIVSSQSVLRDQGLIGNQEWHKKAVLEKKFTHFSSPHIQTIYEVSMGEVISASKAFDYKVGNQIRTGVLLIDMNFQGLDSLSNITNMGEKGHILILDAEDQIVYSSDKLRYGYSSISYKVVKDLVFGSSPLTVDGTQMVVNINTISATRWRIATFQDINTFEKSTQSALYTAIGVIIVTMMITFLVAYFLATQITNPLKRLNKAIARFHHGDKDLKVKIEGQKEINIVITAFNEMVDRIHDLMEEVVIEQQGKRRTEIRALQNQINPHFLYNTLDCMIWLAEQNRNSDLIETVSALSTYFRVSLSKGKQFIPIHEELKHIESYLLIQRLRYNNRFAYRIHCKEEVSNLRIMKLLLQPLVENAIYHGLDKDDPESQIEICIIEDGEYLHLIVTNTGYGITEHKINEIYRTMEEGNKKGSIGIKNVYRRIKLFYGEQARIEIVSSLDEKTTVSILIPIDQLEGNQLEEGEAL